jgi:hypothetical protein
MRPLFLSQDERQPSRRQDRPDRAKGKVRMTFRTETAGTLGHGNIKFSDRETLGKNRETRVIGLQAWGDEESLVAVRATYLFRDKVIVG